MVFGEIVVQSGEVASKHLRGFTRSRHQGGVHPFPNRVRANADPAQSGIEIARFCMVRAGMNPRRQGRAEFRIEGDERISGLYARMMRRTYRPICRARQSAHFPRR
jgi:hypothetical protein